MSGAQLRTTREGLGLTQQVAARRWGVSQTYLSLMEAGKRSVPQRLAKRLAGHEPSLATALPLTSDRLEVADHARLLGTLGYPGFVYLAAKRKVTNPAALVMSALQAPQVPARVTEALPWLLVTFPHLDWKWLVDHAKLANRQNRLGYLVVLARQLAERSNSATAAVLQKVEHVLEEARLVKEDSLGRTLTAAERRFLREHRPPAAAHWNLLTTLKVEDLRYVA